MSATKSPKTIHLDQEMHRKLAVLAAASGKTLSEFIHSLLRPVVERRYASFVHGEAKQGTSAE